MKNYFIASDFLHFGFKLMFLLTLVMKPSFAELLPIEETLPNESDHAGQIALYARCGAVRVYNLTGDYYKTHDEAFKEMDLLFEAGDAYAAYHYGQKKGQWTYQREREIRGIAMIMQKMKYLDLYQNAKKPKVLMKDQEYCRDLIKKLKVWKSNQ